jgi:hypothetical protein
MDAAEAVTAAPTPRLAHLVIFERSISKLVTKEREVWKTTRIVRWSGASASSMLASNACAISTRSRSPSISRCLRSARDTVMTAAYATSPPAVALVSSTTAASSGGIADPRLPEARLDPRQAPGQAEDPTSRLTA